MGRQMETEEQREFWKGVEQSAREVDQWPAWLRGVSGGAVNNYTTNASTQAELVNYWRGACEESNKLRKDIEAELAAIRAESERLKAENTALREHNLQLAAEAAWKSLELAELRGEL